MKHKKILILALTALIALFASAACARDREPGDVDATSLIETRQTSIWVEGAILGDMVIGARGTMQVIYVDKELASALTNDFSVQDWARKAAQYYGSGEMRGRALFIAQIETYKPWDFDPTKVFVGGYRLTEKDVLSPSMTNPFGPLESGQKGYFAFAVPASELKAGKEIQIGYGDDSSLWRVPK